jgi:hypothetical protein
VASSLGYLVGTHQAQPLCGFIGNEAVERAPQPLQRLLRRKARELAKDFAARGGAFRSGRRRTPKPREDGGQDAQAVLITGRQLPKLLVSIPAYAISRLARQARRIGICRVEWRITQDDYDRKARELKERQTEIALRIEQHQQGEGDYRTTLESLIFVASRAAEIFERSKTEQRRELIAFVFSNLRLKGRKLEFSLRSPFDLMVNRASYTSWLGD